MVYCSCNHCQCSSNSLACMLAVLSLCRLFDAALVLHCAMLRHVVRLHGSCIVGAWHSPKQCLIITILKLTCAIGGKCIYAVHPVAATSLPFDDTITFCVSWLAALLQLSQKHSQMHFKGHLYGTHCSALEKTALTFVQVSLWQWIKNWTSWQQLKGELPTQQPLLIRQTSGMP